MSTQITEEQSRKKSLMLFFLAAALIGVYYAVSAFPELTLFLNEKPEGKNILFWGKLVLLILAGGGVVTAVTLVPAVIKMQRFKRIKFGKFEAEFNEDGSIEKIDVSNDNS